MRIVSIAALLAVLLTGPAVASDKSFIKKAIKGNYAEISMGELAQKNAKSDEVKAYGDMLVKDHSDANTKALDVAKGMKVTAPSKPTAKQRKDHDAMAKMNGEAFDKAFMKHMVGDHKKDIAEYTKASKEAKGAVADYATNSLPVLQKHLEKAEALAK